MRHELNRSIVEIGEEYERSINRGYFGMDTTASRAENRRMEVLARQINLLRGRDTG